MFSILPSLPPTLLFTLPPSLSPFLSLSFLCILLFCSLCLIFIFFQMVSLIELRLSLNLPSSCLSVQSAEIANVPCYHVHFLFFIFPFLMLFQVLCACLTASSFKNCHLRHVHILRHYEKKECFICAFFRRRKRWEECERDI